MTFFSHSWPTARKENRCDDCGRTIRPGEVYRRGFGADGIVWTWKECAHCSTLVHLIEWDGSDGYGLDDFVEWEPGHVSHLRLKALWRKKWERRDGTLYPIPTLVEHVDSCGFGRIVDVQLRDESGNPVWPRARS